MISERIRYMAYELYSETKNHGLFKRIFNKDIREEYNEKQKDLKMLSYLNEKLINSVKKGEYEEVEKCLKKKAEINF